MARSKDQKGLDRVFSDAGAHRRVAAIIRDQLTSQADVREEALKGLNLREVSKVLDLGCGFGFFTEGLISRLDPGTEVTGVDKYERYREFYLRTARARGHRSRFFSEGINKIRSFDDNAYDLVVCSYALYFFPEYVPEIARILDKDGYMVIITHSCPHMKEFTGLVREILRAEKLQATDLLPYETLINRFCDFNGSDILTPFFGEVKRKEFRSKIVFDISEFGKFEEYFRFKYPFFIPDASNDEGMLTGKILARVREHMEKTGSFRITKDDTIFVCSKPKKIKDR